MCRFNTFHLPGFTLARLPATSGEKAEMGENVPSPVDPLAGWKGTWRLWRFVEKSSFLSIFSRFWWTGLWYRYHVMWYLILSSLGQWCDTYLSGMMWSGWFNNFGLPVNRAVGQMGLSVNCVCSLNKAIYIRKGKPPLYVWYGRPWRGEINWMV